MRPIVFSLWVGCALGLVTSPAAAQPGVAPGTQSEGQGGRIGPAGGGAAPTPPPGAGRGGAPKRGETARAVDADHPGAPGIAGYLVPTFGVTFRPDAVPRDRLDYGFVNTIAGLVFGGETFPGWSYVIHFGLDARGTELVSNVQSGRQTGDFVVSKQLVPGVFIEEITIKYQPHDIIGIKVGQQRIPFAVANTTANTKLMFPTRAGPSQLFLAGADIGLLVMTQFLDERINASAGAFNGSSLGLTGNEIQGKVRNVRGLVYPLRLWVAPLGKLPDAENDFERDKFRFGLGTGLLYRKATVYDDTGYGRLGINDFRFSGSIRATAFGFYAQAEFFRRLRTDDVTSRPQQATGTYGQFSYYQPIASMVAISPIARLGYTVEDETFEPRKTLYIDAGIAFYPAANRTREDGGPESLRILLQYVGERRLTEKENADGALAQLSYHW